MNLDDYCYICYSMNLHYRLKENNIRYYKKGLDVSTNKIFWIYPRTKELSIILTDWSNGVGK